MNTEKIKESIKQRRIKLEIDELLLYFSVPIATFIFGLVPIVIIFIEILSGLQDPIYHLLFPLSLFWGVCLISAIGLFKNLKLTSLEPKLPKSEIRAILVEIALRRKWDVLKQDAEIFMAYTRGDAIFSPAGEYITVLFDHNKIYVNSRCKPEALQVSISKGNKKNREIVIFTIEAFEAKAEKEANAVKSKQI